MKMQEIPISKIKILENHRVNIERTNLDELMQSIKQHGLIQPIGVFQIGKGKYVLKFGQRRYLACQKLGFKTILATISAKPNAEKLLLENLTENMQRTDPSFAELGRIIDKLEKKEKMSLKEIAVRLGFPLQKIKMIVRVFAIFPEKHRKMVSFMKSGAGRVNKKGSIPAHVAMKIVSMKHAHGLDNKAMDTIVHHVSEKGLDSSDLLYVGDLIGSGMSAEKAMENMRAYGVFAINVLARHTIVANLMQEYGLINKKHLFRKIIYGEIPPLVKPDFVNTGISGIKPPKPEKIDNTKFKKMRSELVVLSKAGKLTPEEKAALKPTAGISFSKWTSGQCEQLESMLERNKK